MVKSLMHRWRAELLVFAIAFAMVFLACVFGILTRPMGFLAALWPANAVLLGLMVRWPKMAGISGWAGALVGYFGADLLSGNSFQLTAWLTGANLVGVGVGVILFRRLSPEDMQLKHPLSVLYMFSVLCCSAAATAFVGAGVAPVFFGRDLLSGLAFWFTTELVNAIIVLPVILTANLVWPKKLLRRRPQHERFHLLNQLAPLAALALSITIGLWVGGPGAVAFPSPALLWCALTYPLFLTVLLTMLVSSWHLIAITLGVFAYHQAIDGATMSDRLGVMLLALGPLTVASINTARTALVAQLERQISHDALTGALSRKAFLSRAATKLDERGVPVNVLMLDLDKFKDINDRFGHATGDRVLVAFASTIRQLLREQDIFGRIGGEEFAILLSGMPQDSAATIAERLRGAIEALRLPLEDNTMLSFTVSIGLAHCGSNMHAASSLDQMLAVADKALYQSKDKGRNQVESICICPDDSMQYSA